MEEIRGELRGSSVVHSSKTIKHSLTLILVSGNKLKPNCSESSKEKMWGYQKNKNCIKFD